MSEKQLHIVSFDIPFPPDYGGVIDVFYKIKALHAGGVKIHMHCFEYGRKHSKELEKYCVSVNYYRRKKGFWYLFDSNPYIITTRRSKELLNNLMKDDYPVLFEGLHCCYHVDDLHIERFKIIRMHNIEHRYYEGLAKVEKNIFIKYYFNQEARKLKVWLNVLINKRFTAAISPADVEYLKHEGYKNIEYIPAFHPNTKIEIKPGIGNFALYHGNLSIAENNHAAIYLVTKVFNGLEIPLVIAGNNPSRELIHTASKHKNVKLMADIPTEKIDKLIFEAQINILPTFQATGIKLKLLAALFKGRHCIVNTPMVENTGLELLCSVKNSAEEMKAEVMLLFTKAFSDNEKVKRRELLEKNFSNAENAKKLIRLIWNQ